MEATTAKQMKADDLKSLATRLANECHCRYWLHWNYPVEDPWVMRLEVRNHVTTTEGTELKPVQVQGLAELGMEWDPIDGCYYIDRDIIADGLVKAEVSR